MPYFTIYDADGRILRSGTAPATMLDIQAQVGEFILKEIPADDSLQYIPDTNTPVVTEKPISVVTIDKTTLTADGVDFITVSNLPVDSRISVESTVNEVYLDEPLDSPTDYLTVDAPGDYNITIYAFPYLPFTATITGVIA